MPAPIFASRDAGTLDRTVLEHLAANSASAPLLNDQLTTALKSVLADALANRGYPAVAALVEKIGSTDLAANKDLPLRTFVASQISPLVANDPELKQVVDGVVAQLSTQTTIRQLLALDAPLKANAVFQPDLRKAEINELLGTSPALASQPLRDQFVVLYAAHQGPIQDFWAQLRQQQAFQAPGVVEEIQLTLQLNLLTSNNLTLVKALQAMRQAGALKSVQDLVKLDPNTWTQLINTPVAGEAVSIPPDVPGATPQEKTATYVRTMMDAIRAAFPTAALAQSIAVQPAIDVASVKAVLAQNPGMKPSDGASGAVNLSGLDAGAQAKAAGSLEALRQEMNMFPGLDYSAALSGTAGGAFQNLIRQGVAKFLANSPDFDFQTSHIDRYITGHQPTVFQGLAESDRAAIADQMKRLQRIFRITPKYEEISALLGEGLDSAARISQSSQTSFVQSFQDKVGGQARADELYSQAQHVNAGALNFFTQVHQAIHDVSPRVMGTVAADVQNAIKQIPDWETLFGSLSFCDCQECSSALSAGAYFVDLLQLLKNSAKNSANLAPLDVLTTRRPDLPYVRLTCANTNTPIPYVDLVNEILEAYVANGRLDSTTAQDTGDTSADELSVNPEYTNDAAYVRLQSAVYPLTLPFNRFLDAVRRCLQQMGSSRCKVMQALQRNGGVSDFNGTPTGLAIACEQLGISPEEHAILSGTDLTGAVLAAPRKLPEFYGYPAATATGNLITALQVVPEMLKRIGTSYAGLIELVKTWFLNPLQAITLDAPADADPCDLSATTLKNLDEPTLKKLYKFIRLASRLGWSYRDLDKAIRALGASDIDDLLLVKLSQIKTLQIGLNLSLDSLLSFWADIGTDGRDSLYVQLFQNKAVTSPLDAAFALSYASPLAALPAITFPDPIKNKTSYNAGAKRLSFTGVMRDDERSLLLGLSADSSYGLAVANLYQERRFDGAQLASVGKVSEHLQAISAALRVKPDDLTALVATVLTDDSLSVGNLSVLYRYTTFARALGLSVLQLLSLKTLTNPFALVPFFSAPGNTLTMFEKSREVLQSSFSVEQLDYLARDYDPNGSVGPRSSDVSILFQALNSQLQKITDGPGGVATADSSALTRELAALVDSGSATQIMSAMGANPPYSAALANLPNIVFPDSLKSRINYDAAAKMLRFTGGMTSGQLRTLLALSTDPGYQTAVQTLYQQPRDFLAGLLALNNALLTSLAEALSILIEDNSVSNAYGFVLARLVSRTNLAEQVLSENLRLDPGTTSLLLESLLKSQKPGATTQKAIADFVTASGASPSEAFLKSYRLLHKASLLLNGLKITNSNLQYIASSSADFANFDLNALPLGRSSATAAAIDSNAPSVFAQWERLNSLFTLKNRFARGEILFQIFEAAASGTPPPPGGIAYVDSQLAIASGWDQKELDTLTGSTGFNLTLKDFRNEIQVVRLQAACDLIQELGVSAGKLLSWSADAPDANQAMEVKNAVKAQVDDQAWLSIGKSLNDPLREGSKAALVAYLLSNDPTIQAQSISDSGQLYEYFLIDVDMGACMMTSRIKQAISSIQLFIQRCFLNLEPEVSPDAIDARRWSWMKSYRVWQANREVFLYPENWIEPDLRDDKSPFFKDLESALLQSDVTMDTAEQAFLNYLEEFDKVSRLEISGWYMNWDIFPNYLTFHVFARTPGIPHAYYYRQLHLALNGTSVVQDWAPWEKVPVDIEGDHLIPMVFNSRPRLFWPIFKEVSPQINPPNPDQSPPATQKHWTIQLAWTELKNGKWSARKISTDSVRWPFVVDPSGNIVPYELSNLPAKPDFTFKGLLSDSGPVIVCYVQQPPPSVTPASLIGARTTQPLSYRNGGYDDGGGGTAGGSKPGGNPAYTGKLHITVTNSFDKSALSGVTLFLQKDLSNGKVGPTIDRQITDQNGQYTFTNFDPTPTAAPYAVTASASQAWALPSSDLKASLKSTDTCTFSFKVPPPRRYPFAQFSVMECQGDAVPHYPSQYTQPWDPPGYPPGNEVVYGMYFLQDSSSQPLTLDAGSAPVPTLGKAPSPFDLLPAHQFMSFAANNPFFYEDEQRTYFSVIAGASNNAFTARDAVAPPYPPLQLNNSTRNISYGAVFELTAPAPKVGTPMASNVRSSSLGSSLAYISPLSQLAGMAPNSTASLPIWGLAFSTFYHPHVCNFINALNQGGVPGLLTLHNQQLTNDLAKDHFYTTSALERDNAVTQDGYASEGIACYVHGSQIAGTTPFYRLRSSEHFYTSDATERQNLLATAGWVDQGVACYLFKTQAAGTVPLYRLYNSGLGIHFYTISLLEKNAALASGYHFENIPGYVCSTAMPGMTPLFRLLLPLTVFEQQYVPTPFVHAPYPRENVDFNYSHAYSLYNWELFFHAPLLIASRLSKNQRFEEAQQWFHYIFNPTDSSDYPSPARFWKVLPFFQNTESGRIQDMMRLLDSGTDPEKSQIANQVDQWLGHPFDPHLIARLRPISYQKTVIMKYLDNLIAWGDQLFRQDTIESINQATMLYLLASQILGPRPERLPTRGEIQTKTYNDIANQLDAFGNVLVALENTYPFSSSGSATGNPGVGTTLYFCIPQNATLLGYWDTVADRLYKIRHCMNIAGVVQQLPLFEPPINPALLVQAAAMGVDLSSALSDMAGPAPFYRFTYVLQKALELCAEVRSLGSSLLSALEKKDGEFLGVLRATQETGLLKLVRDVKQKQIDEAYASVVALLKTREVTDLRHNYYAGLTASPSPYLSANEQGQLDDLEQANQLQNIASDLELLSNILNLIPNFTVALPPSATFGGSNLGSAIAAVARMQSIAAADFTYQATKSSILGGHLRRADEWNFQLGLAVKELDQIDEQIAGAQIRAAIAQAELANHDKQIENATGVEEFLRDKYTNQDLYGWMVAQTSAVFFQCYQMAYELAKRAESCFRLERGLTDSNFISFGYWDNLKKGLLAGEQLYLDLKRMELAYMDQNQREYEISKNISLLLLNPLALIALKETGSCLVSLPEAFFDMDYPGHYMRRIRSVSLSIPCVTGPYTSVNCTLTLLKNSVRVNSSPKGGEGKYDRDVNSDDPRFVDNFAATQSIATSSAQNDSGMFEVTFRDERYLVFEGAGNISTWQLDLPKDCNAFDFETISDVILNLRYTARDGGTRLRAASLAERVVPLALAQAASTSKAALLAQPNMLRLFSLRHEFSTDWYRFLNPADTAVSQTIQIALTIERFPFQYRGRKVSIQQMELFLRFKDIYDSNAYKQDPNNPTPQGDYAKGTPLMLSMGPVGGTVVSQPPLVSDSSFFNGIPHSLLDFSTQNAGLATWTLAGDSANIKIIAPSLCKVVTVGGTSYYHLKPEVIDDILVVCHYSVV